MTLNTDADMEVCLLHQKNDMEDSEYEGCCILANNMDTKYGGWY